MFESLDFIYMPSSDPAKDLAFYTDVLGGEAVFAIEHNDVRVAEIKLSGNSPRLLLASHLEGEAPVLLHRVADFDATLEALEQAGAEIEASFEIPHGPCATLHTPGGQRIAIYELTRPQMDERFAGRIEF